MLRLRLTSASHVESHGDRLRHTDVTPFTLLRRAFELRTVAGLLHVVGLLSVGPLSLPLLLLSRVVHGVTLLLVPLIVTWLGTNMPHHEKPQVLAERNTFATAGITIGILIGGVMTGLFSDVVLAGMAPGCLLTLSSVATWYAVPIYFRDTRYLPTGARKAKPGTEGADVPWLHVILSACSNFVGWSGCVLRGAHRPPGGSLRRKRARARPRAQRT